MEKDGAIGIYRVHKKLENILESVLYLPIACFQESM